VVHLVADRLDDLAHSGQPATHPLGQRGRGGAQVPLRIAEEGAFTGKAGPLPKEAQADHLTLAGGRRTRGRLRGQMGLTEFVNDAVSDGADGLLSQFGSLPMRYSCSIPSFTASSMISLTPVWHEAGPPEPLLCCVPCLHKRIILALHAHAALSGYHWREAQEGKCVHLRSYPMKTITKDI
jgi:hypothetical protein